MVNEPDMGTCRPLGRLGIELFWIPFCQNSSTCLSKEAQLHSFVASVYNRDSMSLILFITKVPL